MGSGNLAAEGIRRKLKSTARERQAPAWRVDFGNFGFGRGSTY